MTIGMATTATRPPALPLQAARGPARRHGPHKHRIRRRGDDDRAWELGHCPRQSTEGKLAHTVDVADAGPARHPEVIASAERTPAACLGTRERNGRRPRPSESTTDLRRNVRPDSCAPSNPSAGTGSAALGLMEP
jgi:hypothetical protein